MAGSPLSPQRTASGASAAGFTAGGPPRLAPVLLLSWLPLIGDPLCLAAGWSGIRLLPATLYIGLGKAMRYGVLVGAFGSLA
ncbi:MAG: hypothetical protein AB2820_15415 [Candidatus Thiodiazotropha sp.]